MTNAGGTTGAGRAALMELSSNGASVCASIAHSSRLSCPAAREVCELIRQPFTLAPRSACLVPRSPASWPPPAAHVPCSRAAAGAVQQAAESAADPWPSAALSVTAPSKVPHASLHMRLTTQQPAGVALGLHCRTRRRRSPPPPQAAPADLPPPARTVGRMMPFSCRSTPRLAAAALLALALMLQTSAQPPAQQRGVAEQRAADERGLRALQAGVSNWDAFAAGSGIQGWQAGSRAFCQWTGVACSDQGLVQSM